MIAADQRNALRLRDSDEFTIIEMSSLAETDANVEQLLGCRFSYVCFVAQASA